MGRPSKSTDVLISEGKSHRTKTELDQRAEAEQAALTNLKMRESAEVKSDPIAHAEFKRVTRLLKAVGKYDALYESVINDYCLYKSEIARYMKMLEDVENDVNIKSTDKYKLIMEISDKIERIRKRRFDIEKENGMTIASSARNIPKKVEKNVNPIMAALSNE